MSKTLIAIAFSSFIAQVPLAQSQTADTDHSQHHLPDAPAKPTRPLDSLVKALEKNSPKTKSPRKPSTPQNSTTNSQNPMPMNPQGSSMTNSSGMSGMMGQMMNQMGSSQTDMQQPSSELPGFPGASHIYHIGATGFFINHADLAGLLADQIKRLNAIKEKSTASQVSADQKIKRAEEELWTLTASDRHEIKSIEAKVKEIEAFKSEKRIRFIRNVGEAASVLTNEQRAILLGKTPQTDKRNGGASQKPSPPMPPSNPGVNGMNSMGDM